MDSRSQFLALGTGIGFATTASAYTFQSRFVERVGNADVVLVNNTIDATNSLPRNIRIQFGVFDDAESPAPDGGFFGWNAGRIQIGGSIVNSDERRNPGRLSPFNSSTAPTANGNPPLPFGDPFSDLSDIDATIGNQSLEWLCDTQGNVPAAPQALVRGRNSFVSVFAFSIDPLPGAGTYGILFNGDLLAASSWATIPDSIVTPNCGNPADPSDDMPGRIGYMPLLTAPQSFAIRMFVEIIPAPASAACLGASALAVLRRRRRAR